MSIEGMRNWPDSTIREADWERQMSLSGLQNYENMRADQKASGTVGGKKVIRSLIKKAEKSLDGLQHQLLGAERTPMNHKGVVVVVPPETLALIALQAMIDSSYSTGSPERGAGWQGVCTKIGRAVETEHNFRHWLKASKEKAKAYAKERGYDSVPPSLAERMIAEKRLTRWQINRLKNTIEDLSAYEWDIEEVHYCGDAILTTVVSALPDDFEIIYAAARGSNQKFLRMTDRCRQKLDDVEYSVSRMKTTRKPMLTKPRPWKAH